ncbi:LuxR C-terminal-related transcriptional regulator [Formosa undariae]|uniref:LuxR C-terminal-related transcriptional regulator n=1 Tax=Formosa undariae TaxID=1325436 RepID=A0ABV5F2H8_9FLAO
MLRNTLLLLFLFFVILCRGNTIISIQQNDDKPIIQDNTQNENKIKRLESIIHNSDSTPYDICRAYYEKYLIYKELFNYDQALENLDLALESGLLTDEKEQVKAQFKLEKLLVHFDLLEYDKVSEIISEISDEDLKYITPTTLSFYWMVLARMEIRKGNTDKADKYLNEALDVLLKHEPKQLPLVYRKKIELYKSLGEHDKVIESFETGLFYARKHKIPAYVLGLYDDMTYYYSEIGDFKNAQLAEQKVKRLSTAHDATNRSSKLLKVEKDLLQKRKEQEVEKEKQHQNFLITLVGTLIILLFLLIYFYKSAKKKRIVAEQEMDNMRNELERVTKELNESGHTKLDLNAYSLTERQLQIIDLVKQGKSNKEIGDILFISVNTVKYHLKIIYETLQISNRSEL